MWRTIRLAILRKFCLGDSFSRKPHWTLSEKSSRKLSSYHQSPSSMQGSSSAVTGEKVPTVERNPSKAGGSATFLSWRICSLNLRPKFPCYRFQINFDLTMLLRSLIPSIWFLLGSAVAQNGAFNISTSQIDPSTCVAPSAYTACFDLTVTVEDQCINTAANDAEKNGCGCGGFIEQMNCFASACWNRVC